MPYNKYKRTFGISRWTYLVNFTNSSADIVHEVTPEAKRNAIPPSVHKRLYNLSKVKQNNHPQRPKTSDGVHKEVRVAVVRRDHFLAKINQQDFFRRPTLVEE